MAVAAVSGGFTLLGYGLWTWALVAVSVYAAYRLWRIRAIPIAGVPTPRWVPWWGTLFDVIANFDRYYHWNMDLSKQFGGRSYSMCGPAFPPVLQMACTEAMCRHVLKERFDNYPIGEHRQEALQELFGRGIFGSNGKEWRSHRKAAANIFTLRLLRDDMTPVFIAHGNALVERLRRAATKGEGVDLQDLLFRHTMDSFGEIAFGERLDSQNHAEPHPFAKAFDVVQMLMVQRLFDMTWRVKRYLNISAEKVIKQQLQILNLHAHTFVQHRRRDIEEGKERTDLISHFMAQHKKEGTSASDEDLRDVIINFFVAGRDTTAVALTWLIYELVRSPRVYAAVQAEVDEVMGERDGVPDFEAAAAMSYTEAALLESLRLHPSVPGDDRVALKDDTLPDGTFVPAGTVVSFNPYAFGHAPGLWGADVELFKPERWLDPATDDHKTGASAGGVVPDAMSPRASDLLSPRSAAEFKFEAHSGSGGGADGGSGFDRAATHLKRFSQFAYPTFSGGPRLCLGRGLAILEAKLAIAQMLYAFDFELIPRSPPIDAADPTCAHYSISVTLMMKGGLPVRPKLRARKPAPVAVAAAVAAAAAAVAPTHTAVPIAPAAAVAAEA